MSETTGASAPAASAAGSSPAPSTPSTTPAASTPAPAIAAPASGSDSAAQGPIPFDRHKSVLDGAYKERDDLRRQFDDYRRSVEGDPWGYTQRQLDRLSTHPDYEQSVLRYAAQMLNARRGKFAAPIEKPKPDLPVYDLNGQPTGRYTYSDQALEKLDAFNRQQYDKALADKLGPIESFMGTLQEQAQQA